MLTVIDESVGYPVAIKAAYGGGGVTLAGAVLVVAAVIARARWSRTEAVVGTLLRR
jgi:acetyl/propionyl-CoA carboxylase alpha subunit